MYTREVTVKNKAGLEPKTAALLIQRASSYKANIWIERDERKASAKSLLGLLSLSIGPGNKILVAAEGEDESEAVNGLVEYLNGNFTE